MGKSRARNPTQNPTQNPTGPLTREAEEAGNFGPGSQANHPAKGGSLVAQGIMPILLSVFVAVSAYESVVPVRVNDRVGGGVTD